MIDERINELKSVVNNKWFYYFIAIIIAVILFTVLTSKGASTSEISQILGVRLTIIILLFLGASGYIKSRNKN